MAPHAPRPEWRAIPGQPNVPPPLAQADEQLQAAAANYERAGSAAQASATRDLLAQRKAARAGGAGDVPTSWQASVRYATTMSDPTSA